jgi:hypothetical protein
VLLANFISTLTSRELDIIRPLVFSDVFVDDAVLAFNSPWIYPQDNGIESNLEIPDKFLVGLPNEGFDLGHVAIFRLTPAEPGAAWGKENLDTRFLGVTVDLCFLEGCCWSASRAYVVVVALALAPRCSAFRIWCLPDGLLNMQACGCGGYRVFGNGSMLQVRVDSSLG